MLVFRLKKENKVVFFLHKNAYSVCRTVLGNNSAMRSCSNIFTMGHQVLMEASQKLFASSELYHNILIRIVQSLLLLEI